MWKNIWNHEKDGKGENCGLGGSSRSMTNQYELWASHLTSLSAGFICKSEGEASGQ